MGETQVINLRTDKCKVYVYIGRGSKWGNPFKLGVHRTRKQAIMEYEEYIRGRKDLMGSLGELKGKKLGCYCKPLACHGDILIKLMNEK